MQTILIIGGTSGIGASFARRFHSMNKKIIVTGRRQGRLDELKNELPGLEGYAMDNTDLPSISHHVDEIFSKWTDIDTVWINGGIQHASSITDLSSSSDEKVMQEVTTNVTAPMILARHVIPRLQQRKGEANFMITSSGLGFIPMGIFPYYCPTKSAMHSFLVGIRQSLRDTNVNVLEIVPPYVSTDLDVGHREAVGSLKAMSLEEFTNGIFEVLESKPARELKEVTTGSAAKSVEAWRSAIGPILEGRGVGG